MSLSLGIFVASRNTSIKSTEMFRDIDANDVYIIVRVTANKITKIEFVEDNKTFFESGASKGRRLMKSADIESIARRFTSVYFSDKNKVAVIPSVIHFLGHMSSNDDDKEWFHNISNDMLRSDHEFSSYVTDGEFGTYTVDDIESANQVVQDNTTYSDVSFDRPKENDKDKHDDDMGEEPGELREDGDITEPDEEDKKNLKRNIFDEEEDNPAKKPRKALLSDDSSGGDDPTDNNMSKEDEFEVEMMRIISAACDHTQYDGFDPSKVRAKFSKKFNDKREFTELLCIAFVVYMRIGNNIEKLSKKRVELAESKRLINRLNQLGLVAKAADKESLTLPRIAISYMPEYLTFRKMLIHKLDTLIPNSVEVTYQDICFCGNPTISNMTGYDDFNLKFSAVIAENGQGIADDEKSEKKLKEDVERWNRISQDGYEKDKKIHERMDLAIKGNDVGFAFISIAWEHYMEDDEE